MTSKKSQRKRSNPAKKQSAFESKGVKIGIVIIFIAIVAIAAVYLYSGSSDESNGVVGNPVAVINTTEGIIKVELYNDKVPNTCENFIKLANEEFYDGMIFHRIKDDFMIQAGRLMQDGTDKSSPYPNIAFETHPNVTHVDGAISMASTDARVGGSAEFFICDGAQSGLDGNYAAFGLVIEGIDVVRAIAAAENDGSLEPTPENPYLPGGGKPLADIIINSIIIENQ